MRNEIPIEYVSDYMWSECNNAGACCYTCPHFEECDNHEDLDE